MNPLTQQLDSIPVNPVLEQRLPAEKTATEDWYLGQSDIEGQGVFAGRPFDAGETIDVAMTDGDQDEWDAKIWNLTTLARYCNHQLNANVKVQKVDNRFDLVTTKPVQQDDELVANYVQVSRAIGPHARMQWQGEDIPANDLEDYTEKESAAKLKWIHSCCKLPSGECPGCPEWSQMILEKDNEDS